MSSQSQIVEEIFHEVLDRSASERACYLADACRGDEDLRRQVESMISSYEQAGSFLDQPAIERDSYVLGDRHPSLPPGEMIGSYRVIRLLGTGGMGEVYLAEDVRLGRHVALKLLPSPFASDEDRLRRFEHEARAASALNHPNILTIHEIGSHRRTRFISTEFIEGVTLRQKFKTAEVKLEEKLRIVEQIATALDAAHGRSIVHRDIKPENVMVRNDGLVKILDFGLAKLTQKKNAVVDSEGPTDVQIRTQPGLVIGTIAYMSPEQARGIEVDSRTDIWSLGIVFYEMLTGKVPFSGETATDCLAAILKTEPAPVEYYEDHISNELNRIIGKSLAKNRDERFQTAREFLVDLKHLQRQLQIQREIEPAPSALINNSQNEGSYERASVLARLPAMMSSHLVVSVVTALVLLPVLGALSYRFFGGRALIDAPLSAAIESMAVLPFENVSGDKDIEYLSDGMTESLIDSLSQLPKLSVKARSTVFRYKGKEVEPQRVAAELSVQAILTGRLVQRGEELTLFLSLADGRTGNQIWGEQYHRSMAELVGLQNEIAIDVSRKLRARLSGTDQQRVAKNYTDNTQAYQLFLKGRFYWNKRSDERLKQSIGYFNQAIEADPNYALAYVGLADTYNLLPIYSTETSKDSIPKAKVAAKKALEIDDTLAEAHASLAHALFFDWNFPESIKEFQRSIELNPNYANTHNWYGLVLRSLGRLDEAVDELKKGQQLDPFSLSINSDLGATYLYKREYDSAIAQLRKTLEMDTDFAYAYEMLGTAYEMKGSFQAAIDEYRRARGLSDNPRILGLLGHAYAKVSRKSDALGAIHQLDQRATQSYVPAYAYAFIYAGLGDKDEAFKWLEKSYQERSYIMTRIKIDPLFDSLRNDPRFEDLLRRVGLTQ